MLDHIAIWIGMSEIGLEIAGNIVGDKQFRLQYRFAATIKNINKKQ